MGHCEIASDANAAAARAERRQPRWPKLATLCIAPLLATLDTSVANLAVRPIGHSFRASVGTLQWMVDGYNLMYAAFLLTGGLLADLYGRRRVFIAGTAVFTLASVVCALAPAAAILIGGRVLAGLGAALMVPASLALVRVAWPDAKARGNALGFWAGCNGVALALGPPLGGILIVGFGWRSIFLVVVPFGLAVLLLAHRCLPGSSDPRGRRFDMAGQALGALALGTLAVAAIESQRLPGEALAAFAAAGLALTLFIRVEMRAGTAALVPTELFRVPAFRGAMAATLGITFGMYGVLFLLPLMWQRTGMLDPVGAGIALLPMALVFVLVSFLLSGMLSAHLGTRAVTSGGVTVIACGLFSIGWTAQSGSLAGAEVGLALTGLGMGLATGPLMNTAVGAVSAARSGTAGSLINVARMVGATLGVAVLGAVFALGQGGPQGLSWAMLIGGGVQLASASVAWFPTPSYRA